MKLLLVDDEDLTRQGLMQYVDWNNLGITHVKGAANGLAALNILDSFQPDILLTDIKMPHMTGIELARKIREKKINCRILFISGYAEKEYLKSAIDLKVEAYIDKPATPANVEKVVSKVVASILQEREESKKELLMEQNLGQASDIVRGKIAQILIQDHCNTQELRSRFSSSWFDWPDYDNYCAVSISIFLPEALEHSSYQYYRIRNYFGQYHLLHQEQYFADTNAQNNIFFLIRGATQEHIHQIFVRLQKWIMDEYQLNSQACIGPTVSSLESLYTSYQASVHLLDLALFYNDNTPIIRNDFPREHYFPEKLLTDLNSNPEKIFSMIAAEKYTNIDLIRQRLYEKYLQLPGEIPSMDVYSWEKFSRLSLQQYEALFLQDNPLKAYLHRGQDLKIKQAIQYILQNFENENLSIKMIADQVELSQNYFCTLFKQNTEMTVHDFILQIRIDKAKSLLKNTNLKLYEISEQVGIPDANYLNIIFKKHCHMTPSQFRKET